MMVFSSGCCYLEILPVFPHYNNTRNYICIFRLRGLIAEIIIYWEARNRDHLSSKSTIIILSALRMTMSLPFFDANGKLQKMRFNFNDINRKISGITSNRLAMNGKLLWFKRKPPKCVSIVMWITKEENGWWRNIPIFDKLNWKNELLIKV